MKLEVQIQKIDEMKASLNDICRYMSQTMQEVDTQLAAHRANGFSTEKADKYRTDYLTNTQGKVDDVIKKIQSAHQQYLDDVRERLVRALRR